MSVKALEYFVAGLCRTPAPQKRHSSHHGQILIVGSLDIDSIPEYGATQPRNKVGNWLPTLPIRFAPSLSVLDWSRYALERQIWRPALATRFCTRILLFLTLSLFFFSARSANAGSDEWPPLDPADLKMTSEPLAPGAPAIYLYRQVDRKDLGRANTEYNFVRIKILNEEGRRFANVEIPYRRDRSNVSGIRARTIRPDGSIVNFDGKVFDKTLEKAKGEKYQAKTFTVPDVQVGSIVEYHFNYDYEDGFVFDSYWLLSEQLFTKTAKFTLKPYPRFDVRWVWPIGLPPGTDQPKLEPDGFVRLTAHNIPAFQREDYMPPENELKYRVIFIYSEEGFEMDPPKYWRKYGKKQNDRLESFISKRKDLESAVSQIVSPNDPPDVKLQKIYTRCQQLRNLTYELFKSKVEEKHDNQKTPENVADVLKFEYGFATEINWLFVGLARAAGLDASAVRVSSRSENFFTEARLNSAELNWTIASVKLGGKDLYFDPGTPFLPFGLLPWPKTNVKGLKLDKEGGSWVTTPFPESSASQFQRKGDLKLNEEGTLEGKITFTFTGLEAATRRLSERNQDDEARKKYFEDLIKDYVPSAMDAALINQPDWKTSSQPLVAEFDVKIANWTNPAGRNVIFPVGLFSAREKHMFEHANRVNPIYFSFPFVTQDDITVAIPFNWKVSATPKDVDQNAKAAEYILKIVGKPDSLHIARSVRSDLFLVPKEMYPSLRGFFQVVKTADDQQIVLQTSTVAATN